MLKPVTISWVHGSADDPADLCAHGQVALCVGGNLLVDPERTPNVTVSAAALYLLRTLQREHTRTAPVGDHLFPCCGFALLEAPDSADVAIIGCPNGIDFEVLHAHVRDAVIVRAEDRREWRVGWSEWQSAVFSFADAVSEFYAVSSPKKPSADDKPGFRRFVAEWERRRGRAFGVSPQ